MLNSPSPARTLSHRSRVGTPRASRGTTMIEVLVTIIVVSMGLLGYAGLLANSQKSNLTAYWHGQATILADDITESMRTNRAAALASNYNIAIGSSATGSTIPATEVATWKSNLSTSLPSGDGSISVVLGGKATITIRWTDNAGTAQTLTTETQL